MTVVRSVTIRDVAKAAGVSKTTATCVLNQTVGFKVSDTTRSRIFETAEELGYRYNAVAAALTRGRTDTVGLVIPWENRELGPSAYLRDLVMAVGQAAYSRGLRLSLLPLDVVTPTTIQSLIDGRVDGLILSLVTDQALIQQVEASGVPVVVLGHEAGRYRIEEDSAEGARQIANHLLSLGHRRFVHLMPDRLGGANVIRRDAFLAQVAEFEGTQVHVCQGVEPLADTLQSDPYPTALFAFNDALAVEALRVAQRLGRRVPEDLSVAGFDDCLVARVCIPPLTTVINPFEAIAQAALDTLGALQRKEPASTTQILPVSLAIRESTGPAPA